MVGSLILLLVVTSRERLMLPLVPKEVRLAPFGVVNFELSFVCLCSGTHIFVVVVANVLFFCLRTASRQFAN